MQPDPAEGRSLSDRSIRRVGDALILPVGGLSTVADEIDRLRAENEHLKELLDASRDAVEALLQQTAYVANEMAEAAPGQFDLIGAGTGVGIRLTALEDARKAIVTAGLKVHESRGAFDEEEQVPDLDHHARWLAEHGQPLNPEECAECQALASREEGAQ